MTARRWLVWGVAGVALVLIAGRFISGEYADWSWYAAMGALPVYRLRLFHEWGLRSTAFVCAFALAYANLYAVRRSIVSLVLPRRLANFDFGEEVPGNRLNVVVMVLALVIAMVLAAPMDDWLTVAQARLGIPFGERDPYFDREFGFYVYALPLQRLAFDWVTTALLLIGAIVVLLYAVTPSFRWHKGQLHVSTYVRRHLAALGAVALLVVGWSVHLEAVSLLTEGAGVNGAFTAFDDRVLSPLLTSISVGAYAASITFFFFAWKGFRHIAIALFVLVVLAAPGARLVLPLFDRGSTPAADRAARERPYEATRMQFSRRAFGVDQVVDADALKVPPMTRTEAATGVAVWEALMLARSAELAHRDHRMLGVAWDPSLAGLAAITVQRAARTPGPATLTRLSAIATDEQGRLPVPATQGSDGAEARASVVLVEPGAVPFAIVADSADDIPAPRFASRLDRLAHAWHLQMPQLLAATLPEPRPKVLLHRDVRDRISALAPFFTVGPTLQAVVAGDSLYWLAELFATSDEYPLVRPMQFAGAPRRYARFAGTALVDARRGRVRIVTARTPDAVTRTWMREFPWLFVTRESLPVALAEALPPAIDRAMLQAEAIARDGYQGDETSPTRGAAPREASAVPREVAAMLFALHGTAGPLAANFAVLESGDRLVGVVLSRGGVLPRAEWHRVGDSLSWRGVLDSLWSGARRDGLIGTAGGADRRGQVQLIPLAEGIAFAQAFYNWPSDRAPALRGVVVLSGGRMRSGATIAEALGLGRTPLLQQSSGLRSRVNALYDLMGAAMRRGDWRAFGDAYATLGRLLRGVP